MNNTARQKTAAPSRIRVAVEQGDAALDDFVRHHPRGSIYHLSPWRRIAERRFGQRASTLVARRHGSLIGVLPLVRLRSLLFGDFMVSMPWVNYGGPLAEDAQSEMLLREAAAVLARRAGCKHLELRETEPVPQWPVRTDKAAMLLPLPAQSEQLWAALANKRRAQIRRPQREGATVVHGGAALIPEFYHVFARNMRDLGTPVYPRAFFEDICAAFPEQASLSVVRLGGQPAAAAFLLRDGVRMEVPWASSLRAVNHLAVNMYLYWSLLEQAIARGCSVFDFGRSTVDSGTYHFKRQWGAQPHPLYWHYWLRDGVEPPVMNPHNPRYALAVRAWQRMPLPLAQWLGPRIVRSLP